MNEPTSISLLPNPATSSQHSTRHFFALPLSLNSPFTQIYSSTSGRNLLDRALPITSFVISTYTPRLIENAALPSKPLVPSVHFQQLLMTTLYSSPATPSAQLDAIYTAKSDRSTNATHLTSPNDRFLLPQRKDYQQQYYNIYCARLDQYKPFFSTQIRHILQTEHQNLPSPSSVEELQLWENIPDAKPAHECVILGLTYKSADKKPSILEAVGFSHQKADNSIWKLQYPSRITETEPCNDGDGNPITRSNTTQFPIETEDKSHKMHTSMKNIHPNDMLLVNSKNYTQQGDVLHLEDRSGRVPLVFTANSRFYRGTISSASPFYQKSNTHVAQSMSDVPSHSSDPSPLPGPLQYLDEPIDHSVFVSGQIIAVQGRICENTGEFIVARVFLPSLHYQPFISLPSLTSSPSHSTQQSSKNPKFFAFPPSFDTDRYTVLLSGINLSGTTAPPTELTKLNRVYIDILLDLLGGSLTTNEAETTIFSKITHCVIAGDLIGTNPDNAQDILLPNKSTSLKKSSNAMSMNAKDKKITNSSALRLADLFITRLCSNMEVYHMPGLHDPTNYALPQQAFNTCLLPSSSTYTTFHGVTNPAQFTIHNDIYLGTDGANIIDITKYSKLSFMGGLSLVLQSQHIVPTAPDTLGCYPYLTTDPMLFINEMITMDSQQNVQNAREIAMQQQQLGSLSTSPSKLGKGSKPRRTTPQESTQGMMKSPSQPTILFAGNAPHFQSAVIKASTLALFDTQTNTFHDGKDQNDENDENSSNLVHLICIPNFSTTASFVIMNQRTKECIPVYLGDMFNRLDESDATFTTVSPSTSISLSTSSSVPPNDLVSPTKSATTTTTATKATANQFESIQMMLQLMNLQAGHEEEHASIDFEDDDDEMGMGGD